MNLERIKTADGQYDIPRLEELLAEADPARDFVLHFQPQYDAAERRLVGAEVFPRLRGAEDCPACHIIPIAEKVGLMKKLGTWIAETAIRQQAEWQKISGLTFTMTLNLSAQELQDAVYLNRLSELLDETGISAKQVILDISNDVMMGVVDTAKETLCSLHDRGFTLSLNEFGGGNINLSYIVDCGFSCIKLSQRLVAVEEADRKSVSGLVHAILAMTRILDVKPYAVGVETESQKDWLLFLGVRHMQGYFFSKPVNARDFAGGLLYKDGMPGI